MKNTSIKFQFPEISLVEKIHRFYIGYSASDVSDTNIKVPKSLIMSVNYEISLNHTINNKSIIEIIACTLCTLCR